MAASEQHDGYGEQQKHNQMHLARTITTFLLVFVHQPS